MTALANGMQPACPTPYQTGGHWGLTRREKFSLELLKVFLARGGVPDSDNLDHLEQTFCRAAVRLADALLVELAESFGPEA